MATITAVELGADTCVLVRTSVRRGAVHVLAVETLDPAAFPGPDAFTLAVRQARRALKLPRRCHAVVWGLPDGANRKDVAVRPLLAPLIGAGLKVVRVVSPCNALAALARLKSIRGDGATCWLAVNRGGVAIVVVRPGTQLYSHSFAWDSSVGTSGSQARLLQRYSLVAILAPEVKRAMAEARKNGVAVEAVVTCGNLPDLRSLTMPLIEELDVEVETLDSLDGLVVKPAVAERLADVASAIRLACAGLLARGTRPWDEKRRLAVRRTRAALRIAAAAALILGIGYAWYMPLKLPSVTAVLSRVTETRSASPAKPPWKPPAAAPQSASSAVSTPPAAAAPAVPAPAVSEPAKRPESNPPAVSEPAKRPESIPPLVNAKSLPLAPSVPAQPSASRSAPRVPAQSASSVASAPKPGAGRVTVPPSVPKPAPPRPDPPAVSAATAVPKPDPVTAPAAANTPAALRTPNPPSVAAAAARALEINPRTSAPAPRAADPGPRAPDLAARSGSSLNTPAVPADKPEAAPNRPLPALLKDPLPRVTTILVASDRRFATIENGQIIGIGDLLGRRVVVAIDERTVVLREPSGVQIRVGLGGRVVAVGRNDR